MLVNCNSCQKKFNVPDSAITEAGRLLQCGSCGNKWTQYPIQEKTVKNEKPKKEIPNITVAKEKQIPKRNNTKKTTKRKKREISLYSEEYLKKKYGLTINDTLSNKKDKKISGSSNFFGYIIISTVFIISLFAILNLTKDFLVLNYPTAETYINRFYEVLEILKITILDVVN